MLPRRYDREVRACSGGSRVRPATSIHCVVVFATHWGRNRLPGPQAGDPFGGLEVTHIDKLKGGQMRIIYLVPVIFVTLFAAVPLTGQSGLAETAAQAAADECVSRPGATAPQGSHWYYRVNRADSRHCWYLGPEGARARVREAAPPTRTSSPRPLRQRNAGRLADASAAQTAPAEAMPA